MTRDFASHNRLAVRRKFSIAGFAKEVGAAIDPSIFNDRLMGRVDVSRAVATLHQEVNQVAAANAAVM